MGEQHDTCAAKCMIQHILAVAVALRRLAHPFQRCKRSPPLGPTLVHYAHMNANPRRPPLKPNWNCR